MYRVFRAPNATSSPLSVNRIEARIFVDRICLEYSVLVEDENSSGTSAVRFLLFPVCPVSLNVRNPVTNVFPCNRCILTTIFPFTGRNTGEDKKIRSHVNRHAIEKRGEYSPVELHRLETSGSSPTKPDRDKPHH